MSRMSGYIQVPSEEVDNYVKLFLSSCNSFLNASKDLKHWDDKDKEDNKKSKKEIGTGGLHVQCARDV